MSWALASTASGPNTPERLSTQLITPTSHALLALTRRNAPRFL
jgi:hypothetical protein